MTEVIKSDIFGKGMVPKLDVVTVGFRKKEIKKQEVIKNSTVKRKDMKMLRFDLVRT